jgi:hypothetical protein
MSDRSAGYVTDVGTFGYHAALNPLATRLAFLRAGLEPPRIVTACELGFGQGVSLAVHAAASHARWWGDDLLPDHVRFAQSLDAAAGSGSTLAEATFEEFAQRGDLPQFDFIGLHGCSAGSRPRTARIAASCGTDCARWRRVYRLQRSWVGRHGPTPPAMAEHAARKGFAVRWVSTDAPSPHACRHAPLAVRATPRCRALRTVAPR